MKFDGHSHTHYSPDSGLSPKKHVKTAKKLGICMAVTDHNTTSSWKKMKEVSKKYSHPVVLGEEIKILEKNKAIGEIIGLFMNTEVPPSSLEIVLDQLKSQDALIVIPHPFDLYRKPLLAGLEEKQAIETAKKVDAIEAFNARIYRKKFNLKAKSFALRHGIPFTAGSDAHFESEIGNAFMELNCDEPSEIRDAIKKPKKIFWKKSSYLNHLRTQATKLEKKFGVYNYER